MKIKFPNKDFFFSIRFFRWLLVIIGIIVIAFNDTLGKLEGFVEFLLLYFIALMVIVAQWLFVNIRAILNLKNEKAKTELRHLQSQVNPHFFFNMLNNLYGLVDKDSEKAKLLILKLSDMMRYSIYEGQGEKTSLGEEVDFIHNYVALHQMRYYKSITVDLNTKDVDRELELTPLLFIILVENAFKHGVEKLRKDAFVQIVIASDANSISIRVKNNFDTEIQGEHGIGLKNLKRRLELAYPNKHQFKQEIRDTLFKTELILHLS